VVTADALSDDVPLIWASRALLLEKLLDQAPHLLAHRVAALRPTPMHKRQRWESNAATAWLQVIAALGVVNLVDMAVRVDLDSDVDAVVVCDCTCRRRPCT
jgi:hypothetical protein